jgi:hypothetical protein
MTAGFEIRGKAGVKEKRVRRPKSEREGAEEVNHRLEG